MYTEVIHVYIVLLSGAPLKSPVSCPHNRVWTPNSGLDTPRPSQLFRQPLPPAGERGSEISFSWASVATPYSRLVSPINTVICYGVTEWQRGWIRIFLSIVVDGEERLFGHGRNVTNLVGHGLPGENILFVWKKRRGGGGTRCQKKWLLICVNI